MRSRIRKSALIVAVFIIGLVTYVRFFTPSAWNWSSANLQVHIHRLAYIDPISGQPRWNEEGFGWSKRGLFLLDWWRNSRSDHQGGNVETRARLAGITPHGVWVRIVHHETQEGVETVFFDKTLFVPSDKKLRKDISSKFYITAYFQQ